MHENRCRRMGPPGSVITISNLWPITCRKEREKAASIGDIGRGQQRRSACCFLREEEEKADRKNWRV